MTKQQAAVILEGLALKYRRLEERGESALANIHGDLAQALEVALSALEGNT